jgi:hypothetical protein
MAPSRWGSKDRINSKLVKLSYKKGFISLIVNVLQKHATFASKAFPVSKVRRINRLGKPFFESLKIVVTYLCHI